MRTGENELDGNKINSTDRQYQTSKTGQEILIRTETIYGAMEIIRERKKEKN